LIEYSQNIKSVSRLTDLNLFLRRDFLMGLHLFDIQTILLFVIAIELFVIMACHIFKIRF